MFCWLFCTDTMRVGVVDPIPDLPLRYLAFMTPSWISQICSKFAFRTIRKWCTSELCIVRLCYFIFLNELLTWFWGWPHVTRLIYWFDLRLILLWCHHRCQHSFSYDSKIDNSYHVLIIQPGLYTTCDLTRPILLTWRWTHDQTILWSLDNSHWTNLILCRLCLSNLYYIPICGSVIMYVNVVTKSSALHSSLLVSFQEWLVTA
jgi:hypothetical protein